MEIPGTQRFITFSTSVNAFLLLWLGYSVSVISSYTLVWPYMANDCGKRCPAKMFSSESEISRERINTDVQKYAKRGEMFLWWACVHLPTKVLHKIASSSSCFDFARMFSIFSLAVCTSKLLELKQLFYLRLLKYETGYSQLGASRLVGYLPSHIQRALVE